MGSEPGREARRRLLLDRHVHNFPSRNRKSVHPAYGGMVGIAMAVVMAVALALVAPARSQDAGAPGQPAVDPEAVRSTMEALRQNPEQLQALMEQARQNPDQFMQLMQSIRQNPQQLQSLMEQIRQNPDQLNSIVTQAASMSLRERLGASEEEWAVLGPKIDNVNSLQGTSVPASSQTGEWRCPRPVGPPRPPRPSSSRRPPSWPRSPETRNPPPRRSGHPWTPTASPGAGCRGSLVKAIAELDRASDRPPGSHAAAHGDSGFALMGGGGSWNGFLTPFPLFRQ